MKKRVSKIPNVYIPKSIYTLLAEKEDDVEETIKKVVRKYAEKKYPEEVKELD